MKKFLFSVRNTIVNLKKRFTFGKIKVEPRWATCAALTGFFIMHQTHHERVARMIEDTTLSNFKSFLKKELGS